MTTNSLTLEPFAVPRAASAVAQRRNLAFDVFRLIASCAIVWAHAPHSETMMHWQPLSSMGTSFFVGASIYFMIQGLRSKPDRTFSEYAATRILRLYVPFVAWSVLYLAFRDASRAFVTHEPLVPQSPMMLLSGGQTHLWFLPFVLLVTFAGFLIVRPVLKSPGLSELTAMTCLLVGAMFAFAPLPAMQPEVDTVNFARVAWYSLPAAFWGIGLALSDDLFESLKRHPHAVTFAAASVTVLFVGFAVSVGLTVWSKNIAGIAWLIAALCAPPAQWHRRLASLAPLGFGLYLTHPFILGVINAMAKAVHLRDSAILDLVGFVLAIIGGLALAWMLRLSRWTRWLVP